MDEVEKRIVDNMGLVYTQLHRFNRINDADAFSSAMEGLMRAAQTYNGSTAFSTYATVCIYNGIAMYLRKLRKQNSVTIISYNQCIDEDDEITLEQMLGTHISAEIAYLDKERYEFILNTIDDLLINAGSPQAMLVLKYWVESEYVLKQNELASMAGVSQSYVSRVISAFRHKLKKKLEDY